jgi:YVTN family beta-propeller protein
MALYDKLATIATGNVSAAIAINPDGSKVYVANDQDANISVISTSSNTVTSTITLSQANGPPYPRAIACSNNGSLVYASGYNNAKMHTINASTEAVTVSNWVNTSYAMAVGPVSGYVYTSHDPQNTVYNGSNSVTVGTYPLGIAINPSETKLYCCNWYTGNVGSLSVVNIVNNTMAVAASITTGLSNPRYAAVNADGSKVYVTCSGSNKVAVIDASNNTISTSITVGSSPYGIAINKSGTRVYAANSAGTTISVIDTALNIVIGTIAVGASPKWLAINATASRLYSVNTNNTVAVFDINEATSGFFAMF